MNQARSTDSAPDGMLRMVYTESGQNDGDVMGHRTNPLAREGAARAVERAAGATLTN